jgi:hypothetical protein
MMSLDCRALTARWIRYLVALGLFAVTAALPGRAHACGASAGGAAGVSSCSLEEHLEEARAKWRLGAAYAFTSTALRFSGEFRFDESRHVAFATIDYRVTPAWTLELAMGSILEGRLESGLARYDLGPGFLAAFGASYRVLEAREVRPFVALTGQIAFVAASTHPSIGPSTPSTGYEALDARVGVVVGWALWRVLTPYALVRAFGGPVFWKDAAGSALTGTDVHHFQVGAGLLVRVGRSLDIFAEGVPLGEQGISAGAGFAF